MAVHFGYLGHNKRGDIIFNLVNFLEIDTRGIDLLHSIRVAELVSLLSDREKKSKSNTLTAEFSAIDKIFKFLAISKPVDISPLLSNYQQIYSNTSNLKQKELLRLEMRSISNFALSGEVVERQFYIMIWEKYQDGVEVDLTKRAMEIISMFESASIKASILKEKDIIRLCNLINNPAFVNLEDVSVNQTLPFVIGG
ncbi:MAG: hypothetical protein GXY96_08225 [Tissierellia bacterium]|nr:hypothetical protein [Tissierellia bacterium]